MKTAKRCVPYSKINQAENFSAFVSIERDKVRSSFQSDLFQSHETELQADNKIFISMQS